MQAIPQHVGIIMDGNGRWAESKTPSLPRTKGHEAGVERAQEIVLHAKRVGIKHLSLFAFSTENWKRPGYEVSVIKRLGKRFLVRRLRGIDQEAIGVRIIGRREDFGHQTQRLMSLVEWNTKQHTDFILQVALSYGGQQEIARACNLIVEKMRSGELPWQEVTPQLIDQHLYTTGVPNPDLIIRTGGESRTSNFMPWQSIYSEWKVCDQMWPDFTTEHFDECLQYYRGRQRRFGGLAKQQVG